MKQPASVIAAVLLGLFLALWHGMYGLTMSLGSLRGLAFAIEMLIYDDLWWAFQAGWQNILFGLIGLARLLAAALLLGGSVSLLMGRGRSLLIGGAVLALLAHGTGWLADGFVGIIYWQMDDENYYYNLDSSAMPYFLLDLYYTFGSLRLPLRVLFNGATAAGGAIAALAAVGTAMAGPTTAWLALSRSSSDSASADSPATPPATAASPSPSSPASDTPSMTDDESTLPEGDIPQITDPDAEATEMVSGEEIEAMLSVAAEEAAAMRDT